jgi:acetyl esterase
MSLHPDAQKFLEQRERLGSRDVAELSVEEARKQSLYFAALTPGEAVARVADMEIPGAYGAIPLRLYYPHQDATRLPMLLFFHGGGWVVGALETGDTVSRAWTNAVPCLVVAVNYHKAPEYKFPAAVEDAYAATKWVSEHASEIGGDAARLAVCGQSAGGNLAAVVALMARDRGAPHIAFQIPWVPVTDANFETTSYRENATGYGLTRAGMMWFWQHYVNDPADYKNPYAAPLRAKDLSNLPPAFIVAAEYDPLRDDAIAYANALRAAGNRVELRVYDGMIHAWLGAQAFDDAAQVLRRALEM